jgi:hypothetical protein
MTRFAKRTNAGLRRNALVISLMRSTLSALLCPV